jgi:glycosyltransferase involved in cell wall biosynthesis
VLKKIGVKKEKISVIYNALDFTRYPFDDEFVQSIKNHWGGEAKIIVSPGQLNPWKGFDGVVKIMPGLMKELNVKINLLILGKGQELVNLKKLAAELGVSDRVHFLGKIEHGRIMNYFKAADLFILNSNYEGMSHVLLEAMRSEAPIITTNRGGNPEVIIDHENGLTVDYNDEKQLMAAAKKILSDTRLAEELVKKGTENLSRFNWENMVKETLDVLRLKA